MHPFTQLIKPPASETAVRVRRSLPRDCSAEALSQRAARVGASMTLNEATGKCMLQRGMSSWHCSDLHTAVSILAGMESVGKRGVA